MPLKRKMLLKRNTEKKETSKRKGSVNWRQQREKVEMNTKKWKVCGNTSS